MALKAMRRKQLFPVLIPNSMQLQVTHFTKKNSAKILVYINTKGLNGTGKSNILDSICFVLGITNLSQVF